MRGNAGIAITQGITQSTTSGQNSDDYAASQILNGATFVRGPVPALRRHELTTVCGSQSEYELPRNFLGISTGDTLDKGKTRRCTLATMMRVLTIALAVVVILSCATVLITPDNADNIILHKHSVRGHKLLAAPPAQLRPFVLATFHSFTPLIHPPHSSTPPLLALVCVRLC